MLENPRWWQEIEMEFTFKLPRNNKELLEDDDGSNYFVRKVYNANEIPTQLRGETEFNLIQQEKR